MDPEYFKWKLRPFEAEHYYEGVMMRKRDGWEQARMIANHFRSKEDKPIEFPWDEKDAAHPEVDEKEWKETIEWSNNVLQLMNEKHGQ